MSKLQYLKMKTVRTSKINALQLEEQVVHQCPRKQRIVPICVFIAAEVQRPLEGSVIISNGKNMNKASLEYIRIQ